MDNQNNQQPRGGGNRNNRQSLLILLVCILVSMLCMSLFSGLFADSSSRKISYDEFIRMLDSGEVWLEVADTVPFLSYTIISGSEPGNLQEDGCAEVVDGTSGGKIFIGTAQSSDCRFFKVKRAE